MAGAFDIVQSGSDIEEVELAQLVVRNMREATKLRLKARATENGRTLEAEVRALLEAAVAPQAEVASGRRNFVDTLIKQQAENPIDDEAREQFQKNMAELRANWTVREIDFGDDPGETQ